MRTTPTTILATVLTLACSVPDPPTPPPGAEGAGVPAKFVELPEGGPVGTAPSADVVQDGPADAVVDPDIIVAGAPPSYGRITPPGFILREGEGVKLSGTIAYMGQTDPIGTLTLEVAVDPGQGKPTTGPLHVQELEGPGEWSLLVPEDLGPVQLLAYFDADMNGPGEDEYQGHYGSPLTVAKAAITGLDISIDGDRIPKTDLVDPPPGEAQGEPSAAPAPQDEGELPTPAEAAPE